MDQANALAVVREGRVAWSKANTLGLLAETLFSPLMEKARAFTGVFAGTLWATRHHRGKAVVTQPQDSHPLSRQVILALISVGFLVYIAGSAKADTRANWSCNLLQRKCI